MYRFKVYQVTLIVLLIAFFAGCSTPKPLAKPLWYTSPPKDYKNFYAVGSAKTLKKAKNRAVVLLRNNLINTLDVEFKKDTHPLSKISKSYLNKILKENTHFVKQLHLKGIKIEKSINFKGRFLVLISIEKKKLFKKVQKTSSKKFENIVNKYELLKDEIAIKRYGTIKSLLKEYAPLATSTQFKKNCISTYRAYKEFAFLKKLNDEYTGLQKRLSIYVLGDANSKVFTKYIKRAIKKEGIRISKIPTSKDALRLVIRSVTTDSQEYSFMKSSTLIKLNTYDVNKKKISFRQHTFIGKSRKSYKEAKDQSAIHLNGKIKRFGFYDFIGLLPPKFYKTKHEEITNIN